MKRETEFRGYDVENERWRYGSFQKRQVYTPQPLGTTEYEYNKSYIYYIIWDGFSDWGMSKPCYRADVSPESVGQWTGEYDRNKKKIYEGDIVATGLTDEKDEFVVKFVDKFMGWYIERESDGWREFLAPILGNQHYNEVIGNTYEKETTEVVS